MVPCVGTHVLKSLVSWRVWVCPFQEDWNKTLAVPLFSQKLLKNYNQNMNLLITKWNTVYSTSPFAHNYATSSKVNIWLCMMYYWYLKFSPNFMWRYKKVTTSHIVWRWQVYNLRFREKNYGCTKYATLAKFHFNFYYIQTMHCCDAQMIYNSKF